MSGHDNTSDVTVRTIADERFVRERRADVTIPPVSTDLVLAAEGLDDLIVSTRTAELYYLE